MFMRGAVNGEHGSAANKSHDNTNQAPTDHGQYQRADELFGIMAENCNFNPDEAETLSHEDLVLLYKNIDLGTQLMSNAKAAVSQGAPNRYVETVVHLDDSDTEDSSDIESWHTPLQPNKESLNLINLKSSHDHDLCHKNGGVVLQSAILYENYFQNSLSTREFLNPDLNLNDDKSLPTCFIDYMCGDRFRDHDGFFMENIIRHVKNTIAQLERISNGEYLTAKAKEKWRSTYKEAVNRDIQYLSSTLLTPSTSSPLYTDSKVNETISKWDEIVHSEIDFGSVTKMIAKEFVKIPRLISSGSYKSLDETCSDNVVMNCNMQTLSINNTKSLDETCSDNVVMNCNMQTLSINNTKSLDESCSDNVVMNCNMRSLTINNTVLCSPRFDIVLKIDNYKSINNDDDKILKLVQHEAKSRIQEMEESAEEWNDAQEKCSIEELFIKDAKDATISKQNEIIHVPAVGRENRDHLNESDDETHAKTSAVNSRDIENNGNSNNFVSTPMDDGSSHIDTFQSSPVEIPFEPPTEIQTINEQVSHLDRNDDEMPITTAISINNIDNNQGLKDVESSSKSLPKSVRIQDICTYSETVNQFELSSEIQKLKKFPTIEEPNDETSLLKNQKSSTKIRTESPLENKTTLFYQEKKRKKLLEIREKRGKKKMATLKQCKPTRSSENGSSKAQAATSVTKLSITNKAFYNSIFGNKITTISKVDRRTKIKKENGLHLSRDSEDEYSDIDSDISYLKRKVDHDTSFTSSVSESCQDIDRNLENSLKQIHQEADKSNFLQVVLPKPNDFSCQGPKDKKSEEANEKLSKNKPCPDKVVECRQRIDKIYGLLKKSSNDSIKMTSESNQQPEKALISNQKRVKFTPKVPEVIKPKPRIDSNKLGEKSRAMFNSIKPIKATPVEQLQVAVQKARERNVVYAKAAKDSVAQKRNDLNNTRIKETTLQRKEILVKDAKILMERNMQSSMRPKPPPPVPRNNVIDRNFERKKLVDLINEVKEARGEAVKGPSTTLSRLTSLAPARKPCLLSHGTENHIKQMRNIVPNRIPHRPGVPNRMYHTSVEKTNPNLGDKSRKTEPILSAPSAEWPRRLTTIAKETRSSSTAIQPCNDDVATDKIDAFYIKTPSKIPSHMKHDEGQKKLKAYLKNNLDGMVEECGTTAKESMLKSFKHYTTPSESAQEIFSDPSEYFKSLPKVVQPNVCSQEEIDENNLLKEEMYVIKEADSGFHFDVLANIPVVTDVDNIADTESDEASDSDFPKDDIKIKILVENSLDELEILENAVYSKKLRGAFKKRSNINNFTVTSKQSTKQLINFESGDTKTSVISRSESITFAKPNVVLPDLSKKLQDMIGPIPIDILSYMSTENNQSELLLHVDKNISRTNCKLDSELLSSKTVNDYSLSLCTLFSKGKYSNKSAVNISNYIGCGEVCINNCKIIASTETINQMNFVDQENVKCSKTRMMADEEIQLASSMDALVEVLNEIQKITACQTNITKIPITVYENLYTGSSEALITSSMNPNESKISVKSIESVSKLKSTSSLISVFSECIHLKFANLSNMTSYCVDSREVAVNFPERGDFVDSSNDVPLINLPSMISNSTSTTRLTMDMLRHQPINNQANLDSEDIMNANSIIGKEVVTVIKNLKGEDANDLQEDDTNDINRNFKYKHSIDDGKYVDGMKQLKRDNICTKEEESDKLQRDNTNDLFQNKNDVNDSFVAHKYDDGMKRLKSDIICAKKEDADELQKNDANEVYDSKIYVIDSIIDCKHVDGIEKLKRDILVTIYTLIVLTIFAALCFPGPS